MDIVVDSIAQPVTGIRLEDDGTFFSLFGNGNGNWVELIRVSNVLNIPKQDLEIANYKVALFTHKSWPESQILTIKLDKKRVGVLFSLQSLASEQSTLNRSWHENAFGFIALQKILLGQLLSGRRSARADNVRFIEITELFPKDTVVAVLDQEEILHLSGERVDQEFLRNRLASFAKHGIYLLEEGIVSEYQDQFKANGLALSTAQKSIHLRKFSSELPTNSRNFLLSIFLKTAPHEKHAGFRFFLAYQVFESLIQDLYAQLLVTFVALAQGMNSTDLKDLVNSLQNSLREKDRLRYILNSNPGIVDEAKELLLKCNTMLVNSGTKPETTVDAALYGVRNLMFHRFEDTQALHKELDDVADALFTTVCELSLCYVRITPSL